MRGPHRPLNARTEEVFGYRRDELVGQPLEILLPERFREAHAAHMREFFAHPRTRPMALGLDIWGRKKDGAEFPLEVSLSFVEQGGAPLALALMTDITERKRRGAPPANSEAGEPRVAGGRRRP